METPQGKRNSKAFGAGRWFGDRYPDRALDVLWGSSAYMHVFSPTSPQDNVFSQP